jgi:two-component system, sensor histidine kinase
MNTAVPLDRVRAAQVRSIYRNTTPGMVATLVATTALTAGLTYLGAATPWKAIVFVAVMFIQTGARLALYRAYGSATRVDWKPWAHRFTAGTLAGGLTIGIGAIWMISPDRTELQLIAFLLIFACTSGAVSAFGAYLPSFYVFLVSISLVPCAWLFAQGDVLHVTIGGLYVLWFVAIAEQARRTSLDFMETIRLRFENLDLVEDLRREKSVAEEANAAKSRFLAAASHDLRQPVHALSLFVAALRAHEMDEEARGLLNHIDGSVRSMGGLFGGLLDISRLDAGVVETNRVAFAIQPLIERVCRGLLADAKAKGLAIRIRATRAVVYSDPLLIERVLRNILTNAINYTDHGSVLIGTRRGSELRVQVMDTGRGIPAHELPNVFQEFYQVGNPERDRNKGVGLGLAIVKRLTTLLGHGIHLTSRVKHGTCFAVDIPYATTGAADIASGERTDSFDVRGAGLILVVDDEIAIQVAMKSLLQSWGYSVIASATGDEMLERIATHREVPRLIICDYRLRDHETGSEVIERLRSEYNDEIPGLLITGDTAPDRLKEAQASGYLLLHKPVPNSKLRSAVTHLIKPETTAA